MRVLRRLAPGRRGGCPVPCTVNSTARTGQGALPAPGRSRGAARGAFPGPVAGAALVRAEAHGATTRRHDPVASPARREGRPGARRRVVRRRAIVAALAGTGARVHGAGTKLTSVCVECRLAYTLRTGGGALCGGIAAEGIVRWRGVRADGSASTQGPVPLAISADAGRFVRLAGRTAPVLFEHPVEGRCGATAAALVGRPWALCPHDLC